MNKRIPRGFSKENNLEEGSDN